MSCAHKAHGGSKGAPPSWGGHPPSWGGMQQGEAPAWHSLRWRQLLTGGAQRPPLAHRESPCSPHILGAPWQGKALFLPHPCQASLCAEVTSSASGAEESVCTSPPFPFCELLCPSDLAPTGRRSYL